VILAGLMLRSNTWMHRRVESLRMDANGGTTLHVSVDYTLPPPAIERSRDRVLLPLGFVRKGALRKVNTRGASGQPLPILDSEENGNLAVDMLLALAAQVLPDTIVSSAECRDMLEGVVYCPPEDAPQAVAKFDAWLGSQEDIESGPAHDVFASMTGQLALNFLFAVEIDAAVVGTRSIVKYSYEDELPEIRNISIPTTIARNIPQFGIAASWHFEVEPRPASVFAACTSGSTTSTAPRAASGRTELPGGTRKRSRMSPADRITGLRRRQPTSCSRRNAGGYPALLSGVRC
jgi:hypothetical protein